LSVAQNHFFLSADRLPNQHLERMAYRPPLKSLFDDSYSPHQSVASVAGHVSLHPREKKPVP
jgi:hypothetical protein